MLRHRKHHRGHIRMPGADGVGACQHIAEPLAALGEHRSDQRQQPEGQVDFAEAGEPANQRMTQPNGPAVVAHHPQAEDQLPHGAAAAQRFHGHRHHHGEQHQQTQLQRHKGGLIEADPVEADPEYAQ